MTTKKEYEAMTNEQLWGEDEWYEIRLSEIGEQLDNMEMELQDTDDEDLFPEDLLDEMREEQIAKLMAADAKEAMAT